MFSDHWVSGKCHLPPPAMAQVVMIQAKVALSPIRPSAQGLQTELEGWSCLGANGRWTLDQSHGCTCAMPEPVTPTWLSLNLNNLESSPCSRGQRIRYARKIYPFIRIAKRIELYLWRMHFKEPSWFVQFSRILCQMFEWWTQGRSLELLLQLKIARR